MGADKTEVVTQEARDLLAAQGRPDVPVSAIQVLKWRRDYGAIPVVGDRLGGRSRTANYASEAPGVIAAIALALDNDRNMDRAILDAFGRGIAGIPEKAVRRSYTKHLSDAENAIKRASKLKDVPRTQVPRSLRLPLKESRKGGSSLVTDAVLAILLGERPLAGSDGMTMVVEELAPELTPFYSEPDDKERLLQLASRLGLAGLRLVASRANLELLSRSCSDIRVLIEYSDALQRLVDVTGAHDVALPADVEKILKLVRAMNPVLGKSYGVGVAVPGLILYTVVRTARARRHLRESINGYEASAPRLRIAAAAAESLPEKLRPALAPMRGSLYLAELSKEDRDQFFLVVAQWRADHPVEVALLQTAPEMEQEKASSRT
jgi:hypothetical protein